MFAGSCGGVGADGGRGMRMWHLAGFCGIVRANWMENFLCWCMRRHSRDDVVL